ncbi:DUF1579 domain-containing protein [Microvirga terricola]|uniref:DUF1579 domain-containing protein n=1 Tax=Microvirga terricola TaxID=2719797 RepID=A0ABX0V8U4_9HYPH|nr:DUF1579 domain-containing protein [Microvirga terricola]NIX75671.1 DUF1579 domain-containing protein [Microvirga terricola]
MKAKPTKEHQWLQRLAGDWTATSDDMPTWSESVRSLDGLWFVAEGQGEMPGGGAATTIMTLGFDPKRSRYIGSWVGSMMSHMWIYEGIVDGNVLTLDTEGPDFWSEGRRAKYQDIITFESDDRRVLTSRMLNEDSTWRHVMKASYQRK